MPAYCCAWKYINAKKIDLLTWKSVYWNEYTRSAIVILYCKNKIRIYIGQPTFLHHILKYQFYKLKQETKCCTYDIKFNNINADKLYSVYHTAQNMRYIPFCTCPASMDIQSALFASLQINCSINAFCLTIIDKLRAFMLFFPL